MDRVCLLLSPLAGGHRALLRSGNDLLLQLSHTCVSLWRCRPRGHARHRVPRDACSASGAGQRRPTAAWDCVTKSLRGLRHSVSLSAAFSVPVNRHPRAHVLSTTPPTSAPERLFVQSLSSSRCHPGLIKHKTVINMSFWQISHPHVTQGHDATLPPPGVGAAGSLTHRPVTCVLASCTVSKTRSMFSATRRRDVHDFISGL